MKYTGIHGFIQIDKGRVGEEQYIRPFAGRHLRLQNHSVVFIAIKAADLDLELRIRFEHGHPRGIRNIFLPWIRINDQVACSALLFPDNRASGKGAPYR